MRADAWYSGRVESDASTFIPVAVAPATGRAVEWKVRTWTDLGESEWSEPSRWEDGLLSPSDWSAQWIAPVEPAGGPPRQRSVHQIAGAVTIDGEVASAR